MSFGSLVKNDLNSHNYSFTSHSRWHLMDATAVAATAAATATVCCHLSLRAYLSAFLSLSLSRKVLGLFTAGWCGKILHAP